MKLLLILISVMTFTVETKNSVKTEGLWPYDMECSYACSGTKGNVTDKDTAMLHVSGLDGIIVEKIEVYLTSNKSSGAGIVTMAADGTLFYTKDGTYKDWFGDYNNTTAQALTWTGHQTVSTLEIQVAGKTSSLHIEKYAITWSQGTQQTYTVTLMDGTSTYDALTEPNQGAGVNLPSLPDKDEWHFAAWTNEPFDESQTQPESWIEPGLYKPKGDETLWAVYEYQPTIAPAENLQTGVYIYADTKTNQAMSGGIYEGAAGVADMNANHTNQWYEVQFLADGTATIHLMYTYEYIGFDGTDLVSEPSHWKVYHEGTKTAFYTEVKGQTYLLWPGYLKGYNHNEYKYCTGLAFVNDIAKTPTALYDVSSMMEDQLFTCYPKASQAVETVQSPHQPYVLHFGPYELLIENGKKSLKIKD
jgi:hypothetical protein